MDEHRARRIVVISFIVTILAFIALSYWFDSFLRDERRQLDRDMAHEGFFIGDVSIHDDPRVAIFSH